MRESGVHYDRYVSLESASNSCPSNLDYRAWWFQQVARHCRTSMIYQDNPPYGYFYQPAVGYGYTRDDGVQEPTCATWNARQFMRRALHVAVESGTDNPAPGVYPNVCGSAQARPQLLLPRPDRRIPGFGPAAAGYAAGLVLQAVGHEHRLADAGARGRRHAEVLARAVQPPVPPGRYFLLPLRLGRPGGLLAGGLGPLLAGRSYAGLASLLSQSDREIDAPPHDARLRLHGPRPLAADRLESRRGRRRGNRGAGRTWRNIGAGGLKHYYDAETGEEIEMAGERGGPAARSRQRLSPRAGISAAVALCGQTRRAAARSARTIVARPAADPYRLVPATPRRTEAFARGERASPDRSLGARRSSPSFSPIRGTSSTSTPRPAATSIWATRRSRPPCSTTSSGRCCWSCTSTPPATDRLLKGNAREALNKKVAADGLRLRVGPGPRNVAMERDRSSGQQRASWKSCTRTTDDYRRPAAAPSPAARCGRTSARRWKRGRRK